MVVTLEDHVLMGGYGSAVLELFNEKRMTHAGRPHRLAGPVHRARLDVEELRRKYGLTVENTVAKVRAEFAHAAAAGETVVA